MPTEKIMPRISGVPTSVAILVQAKKSFESELESTDSEWRRVPDVTEEGLLTDKAICMTYAHEDGSPCYCDCGKAKEVLGQGLHRCNPAEHCVVRVILYPHKYGGERLSL